MKTKLASALVLGLALTACPSTDAQAAPDPQRSMTIAVYDYARAKPSLLLEAERTAARILGKAGVETVWLTCPTDHTSPEEPACAPPGAPPTLLILRILPDSMSDRFRGVHGNALGFAALSERLSTNAWIFYDRVKDFSNRQQITFERVLGAVIAHELGHLLLGETAHANAGLMHAAWSRPELLAIEYARLQFSDTERKRILSGAFARQVASTEIAEVSNFDPRTPLN